ncbi:MAG: DNA-3-methyladenine glycosylase [Bdellovibrionota bacterium]
MARKLPSTFYRRDTELVARELLGKTLVRVLKSGERVSGRIVETEAYLGAKDLAAHSSGGLRTARTESMFLAGGHAYVYLIYGMHYCFNVVTREKGEPQAVLIRALEPVDGIDFMYQRRRVKKETDLASGPGKLCEALQIDKSFDRLSLRSDSLFIENATGLSSRNIVSSPRIGVDYAGEAAQWPLRFYERGNPNVSGFKASKR